MERTYSDALTALNTLQSNFSIINAIRQSGRGMNKQAIPEMIEWCRKIGYEPSDFNKLKPIHIAGTKGKGSTSAFISSILGQYLPSSSQSSPLQHKVGLYTSPHLRFVRERIQINGRPLTEETFAKYFFQIWDRLEEAARKAGQPADKTAKPVYFRFLTLMALHTYMSEGVDTAILECGIGGEYDSTNIIEQPTVTGITSLGIDHTFLLGSTIEEIAWHKAGIMKSGAIAFTAPQPEGAMAVLQKRAEDKGLELHRVERHPELEIVKLGLAADFQKTNASLAIQIAAAYLQTLGHTDITTDPLPAEFIRGLEQVKWGGRCETRRENNITWHLDGGHTLESIEVASKWFASEVQASPNPSSSFSDIKASLRRLTPRAPRILLFNQQTRDAPALARSLYSILSASLSTPQPFTHAIFCSNITFASGGYKPDLMSMNSGPGDAEELSVQKGLASAWTGFEAEAAQAKLAGGDRECDVLVERTVEEAVGRVREIVGLAEEEGGIGEGEVVRVLVTGSVHLVGAVLEVLETGGNSQV
ncbi:Folylpolyglutamate synthetase [Schaereria dolodes]|nr:Folylpolyglutamate synthetase [Schaereria dolodes]